MRQYQSGVYYSGEALFIAATLISLSLAAISSGRCEKCFFMWSNPTFMAAGLILDRVLYISARVHFVFGAREVTLS